MPLARDPMSTRNLVRRMLLQAANAEIWLSLARSVARSLIWSRSLARVRALSLVSQLYAAPPRCALPRCAVFLIWLLAGGCQRAVCCPSRKPVSCGTWTENVKAEQAIRTPVPSVCRLVHPSDQTSCYFVPGNVYLMLSQCQRLSEEKKVIAH